jgi:hypothetical protein
MSLTNGKKKLESSRTSQGEYKDSIYRKNHGN